MKKNVSSKRKFILSIILLCIIGLGIGYSYLSQELEIKNTVNYGSMKWNVSFTSAVDYSDEFYEINSAIIDYMGVEMIEVVPSISQDKKTVSLSMNFGNSTNSKFAAVAITLTNDSSFDVALNDIDFSFEDEETENVLVDYIALAGMCWFEDVFTEECEMLQAGDVVAAGESKNILVGFRLSELYNEDLYLTGADYKLNLNFEWIEATGYVEPE